MENKQYHHGNLRNSLIEAGIELINKEGSKELSLRKVAALCGVSQTAPYSHFKSKEDLLEAMRDYVTKQFTDLMNNSIQTSRNKNDPEVLIQMGKSYIMFFINNPKYFPFIFSQEFMQINLSLDGDDSRNYPPFQLFKTTAVPILTKLGLSREKVEDVIISMWATVHGLASIATMKNVHYDKDWESKLEDIIWNK